MNEKVLFRKVLTFAKIRLRIRGNIFEYLGSLGTKFLCSEEGKPYKNLFKLLQIEAAGHNGCKWRYKKIVDAVFLKRPSTELAISNGHT